ncbi:MAG TPA: PP2C family protein-serine/threonine phosphatase [Actinomycetes bacterium]|nr:PP2C family protein-serine/threonine phosphatase [Actinomycetes bacterium]
MSVFDVSTALAGLRHTSPQHVVRAVGEAAAPLARDVVLYLIDFEQEILQPLVDGSALEVPVEESVGATLAGRAFQTGEPVTADRDGAVRVWVPVYEHSVRTGVLAVTVDHAAPEVLDHCENLGMLAGLLVASAARYTDLVHVRKRGRSMSLAASMQWDLLPPLTLRTEQVVVAGMLEPAYEVAGDGFDHSVNGDRVDVALFDGMGHGIGSTLLTTLAMGTYRHQRRERRDLAATHATIDDAIARQFGPDAFVTGVLVRLDTATGALELTNAGHPSPLLLRNRRVVGELATEATVPFGVGSDLGGLGSDLGSLVGDALGDAVSEGGRLVRTALEPGDTVVLYTDGVVEARRPDGEEFGVDRLADLLEREASSERAPEEVLRRLVRAVLEHQGGPLRDDATLVLLRWTGGPGTDEVIPVQPGAVEPS